MAAARSKQPWEMPLSGTSQKTDSEEDYSNLQPWQRPMLSHVDKKGGMKPLVKNQTKKDEAEAEVLKRVDCRFDSHPQIRFG